MLRFLLKAGLVVLFCAVCAGTYLALGRQPSNHRDWKDYLAYTPHVEAGANSFLVNPVNDWTYTGAGPATKSEMTFAARYDELKEVWFVVEPSPYSKLVAHTFLLFEFTDNRVVGVSIEARQENGENYSPWKGLYNNYELLYSWVSARDALERRAVFLAHSVFAYKLELGPKHRESLLRKFLKTTSELETTPRFYNTLFHNCTNELAHEMGYPWNIAFVLTGRSVGYFHRKGVIHSNSLGDHNADLTDWLRMENTQDLSNFNSALLAELHKREPATANAAR